MVLVVYRLTPGEISLDPVSMGDAKLLTLGIGITIGVIVQAASLIPALRRGEDLAQAAVGVSTTACASSAAWPSPSSCTS